MPRSQPWFTLRRIMVVVAIAGVLLGFASYVLALLRDEPGYATVNLFLVVVLTAFLILVACGVGSFVQFLRKDEAQRQRNDAIIRFSEDEKP